ncbi:EF1D factor, partial [Upupa epops]|nr:EF1D factor [Upupa epops]
MRTRKAPCPIEKVWIDKHKYDEAERLHYEREAALAAAAVLAPEEGQEVEEEAVNGVCNDDSGESEVKGDLKRVKNGKKQRKRKRSPKPKPVASSKLDAALTGLVADDVWFDKPLYDQAECIYRKMIADQENQKALEAEQPPVTPGSEALEDALKVKTVSGALPFSHSRLSGCHHVVDGVWVNKLDFDKAEEAYLKKSQLFLSPSDLTLPSECSKTGHVGQRTPDEGYVTALPTPATPSLAPDTAAHSALSPSFPGLDGETANGEPQISSLQALVSEVWLDKPLYDDAEKNFYEKTFDGHPSGKAKQRQHGCPEAPKNPPQGRKSLTAGKHAGTSCAEVTTTSLLSAEQPSPAQYFLHETVWLKKLAYDRAESRYYAAQALKMARAGRVQEPSGGKTSCPAASASHSPAQPKKEMAADAFKHDKVWLDKYKYDDAERRYYERLVNGPAGGKASKQKENGASTILRDIARARENIQKSLAGSTSSSSPGPAGDQNDLLARISHLEAENQSLHTVVADLQTAISKLESRLNALEKSSASHQPSPVPPTQKVEPFSIPSRKVELPSAKKAEPAAAEEDDDDDDIDLFGSDDEEEDQEAARVREERLRQYAEKKAKKPGLIAKSSILLDVKPWDDETDMAKLEECVRSVHMDGLVWGASKLVPVGYGIKKLQIQCVVEDDKVGTDLLEEEITKFEDYVQSVDIAAFNKI